MEIIKTIKNTTHFIIPVRYGEWELDTLSDMTFLPKDPHFFQGTLPAWGTSESLNSYTKISFVPKDEAKLVLDESLFTLSNYLLPTSYGVGREELDIPDYINQLLCLAAQVSEDCFKKTCENIEAKLNVMLMKDTLKTYREDWGTRWVPVVTTLLWEDYLREISYLNSQYIEPYKGILMTPDLGDLDRNILESLNSHLLYRPMTYEQRKPLTPYPNSLRDRIGLKDTGEPKDPTLIPTNIYIDIEDRTWSFGYHDPRYLPNSPIIDSRFAGLVTIPYHLYKRNGLSLPIYIL